MNIKVKFFEEEFVEAIGAGIYGIYVRKNNEADDLLYIGESVFVLVRCATHLYEILKGTGYLGFTKDTIEKKDITLVFKLLSSESDKINRKAEEKRIIKEKKPRLQSGISDRVRPIEEMINEMKKVLDYDI